jgi:acetolactate synthase I/II/III large subunit
LLIHEGMRALNSRLLEPAAAASAAEMVLRQLAADGIDTLFGIPGGPLLPVYEGLHDQRAAIRTVLARHEAGALFAADGFARVAGRPAACAVTAGPGSTNALSAAAVALRDMVPMFILAATPPLAAAGKGAAQDLDTVSLFRQVTKETFLLTAPERAAEVTRHLLHVSRAGRPGPVALCIPADVGRQRACAGEPLSPARYRVGGRPFDPEGVAAAARVLRGARRPAILAGYGAVVSGAGEALLALAQRLACPVASTPRAKGIFPESHPRSLGPFGFAGSALADRVIGDEADVLLVVGSRLGELSSASWTPRLGRKRLIQVDLVPDEIGRNYPVELGLIGDARATLQALCEVVEGAGPGRSRTRDRIGPAAAAARWLDRSGAGEGAGPLRPQRVMAALRDELPANAHLVCDIGNSMCWAIGLLVRDRPGRFHVNLTYGCMGHATPAAIGAQMASADPVVALVGDAAFAMTGSEVHVAVAEKLPGPVWVILDNQGMGMCHAGFALACQGRAPDSFFAHRYDAAAIAEALGAVAFRVERDDELVPALRSALAARRPALVQVRIDRDVVPPMGPRLEALSFASGDRPGGAS